MSKPRPDFTMDDLVAQISEQLATTTEQGMTTRELCAAVGLTPIKANVSKMSNIVSDLIVLGQVECIGRKRVRTVSGYGSAPAYALIEREVTDARD